MKKLAKSELKQFVGGTKEITLFDGYLGGVYGKYFSVWDTETKTLKYYSILGAEVKGSN